MKGRGRWTRVEARVQRPPGSGGQPGNALMVTRSTSRLPAGSTSRPKWRKKSTLMMGNCTAARRKGQLNAFPMKDN